jgi:hypothetical protein
MPAIRRFSAGHGPLPARTSCLHIEGESNCSIAVLPNKVGIDHSEATAFAFVDRSIGNAHLESLEVADLCQQGTYALPSLDFVNN